MYLSSALRIKIIMNNNKKSNIIPGSEWMEPLVLCKPLVGHCSLSHQVEFWLVANPFFVGKLTKSGQKKRTMY